MVCGRHDRKAWRRCTIGMFRVWAQLQKGRGVDAMFEWLLCKRSLYFIILERTLGMESFVWKASVHCQRSLLLFNIVNAVHCKSSLRVVLCSNTDVATALMPFYIASALDCSVWNNIEPAAAAILHCERSLRLAAVTAVAVHL